MNEIIYVLPNTEPLLNLGIVYKSLQNSIPDSKYTIKIHDILSPFYII